MEQIKSKKNLLFIMQIFMILIISVNVLMKPRSDITFDLQNSNINSKELFKTNLFSLEDGCYTVTINYKAAGNNDYRNSAASLEIIDSEGNDAILFDGMQIPFGHQSTSKYMWVKNGFKLNQVYAAFNVSDAAKLEIDSLSINERYLYRLTKLLVLSFLFLIVDVVYFIFTKYKYLDIDKQKRIKVFSALFAISFFASLPVFTSFLYSGHDLSFHLQRITSLAKGLSNGQFPVRMMIDMLNGWGYPNSLYYCDIFLYIPALLHNLLLPLGTCYQIYVFMINLFTSFITYFCFKKITNQRKISLVGTALYVLANYRLVNIYTRAAVGEYTAMMFLPLVLLGMYKIFVGETKNKEWVYLAIGMSGIIMSHTLSFEMVVFFLIMTCIILYKKIFKKDVLKNVGVAAFLCIGLAAWFIVPFLDMMINCDTVVNTLNLHIQNYGLFLIQIFSLFSLGTGGGGYAFTKDEMSLSLGILLFVSIGLICFYFFNFKKDKDKNYKTILILTILSVISVCFTLQYFPWNLLYSFLPEKFAKMFHMIQFPWRYLSIATVLLTFTVIFILKELRKRYGNRVDNLMKYIVIGVVFSTSYFFSSFMNTSLGYYANNRDIIGTQVVSGGEYLLENSNIETISSINYPEYGENLTLLDYTKEKGIINFDIINNSKAVQMIKLPIFNYPYYSAISYDGNNLIISKDDLNRVCINIPASYEGKVRVRYESPIYWRIAEIVSIITLSAMIIYFGYIKFIKK